MMGLILSTIGLLIVGGTLLITITLLFSHTPIQNTTELNHITDIISQHLLDIDAAWYEKETHLLLPQYAEPYHLSLSSEHITITSNTPQSTSHFHVKTLPIPIWIRTTEDIWMTATDFHTHLLKQSGRIGTKIDPIPWNHTVILSLKNEWNNSQTHYLLNPYPLDVDKTVHIEKALIFLDSDQNGLWQTHEPWLSFLLIYQYS